MLIEEQGWKWNAFPIYTKINPGMDIGKEGIESGTE